MPLPYHEVCRQLKAAGFGEVSQKGGHVKFSKISPDGTSIAIVPEHAEVKIGTMRSISRQAGITLEEWGKL
ncbi:MAG: type II toxin-antitoxin system HicA family toxin [Chloracidobacterium sp.]|nr:type II toxin-antitoxin system HicA family toxin [Chloracidobacterium sp.]